jgi:hypothetical protein
MYRRQHFCSLLYPLDDNFFVDDFEINGFASTVEREKHMICVSRQKECVHSTVKYFTHLHLP